MVETRRLAFDDIETVATLSGPVDGPAVVLLHGFPDDRHGWDRQITPLSDAGFRVVALDQRGCGEAGFGADLRSYTAPRLVDDVETALSQLGIERAHVVGHDWGGVVAWTAGIERRRWLDRLVILNVPHPGVFVRFARSHPSQLLRSSYMAFFQIPRLPELVLTASDAALLSWMLSASSSRSAFTSEELDRYRAMWTEPGRIRGMLDWYRAARIAPIPDGRVAAPTAIVWGGRDVALDARMASLSAERCNEVRLTLLERAGHWPHRDRPHEVDRLIIDHLRA